MITSAADAVIVPNSCVPTEHTSPIRQLPVLFRVEWRDRRDTGCHRQNGFSVSLPGRLAVPADVEIGFDRFAASGAFPRFRRPIFVGVRTAVNALVFGEQFFRAGFIGLQDPYPRGDQWAERRKPAERVTDDAG